MSLIEMVPGQVELVVRGAGAGAGASAALVRLFDRPWAEYEVAFGVEAVDDGVRARLEDVTVTVWDDMGGFFDGLARDFRGWEGERVWVNNHLVVTAGFGPDEGVAESARVPMTVPPAFPDPRRRGRTGSSLTL
ncbi:DUF6228 family protein [Kitasatospora purpeofusca]|uniref:DUF6228 family protein n=1 Tax=Kitasatospora purpeofusca TaxID=67352 RepID=UPI002E1639EC|nr:DUF6228 family protein [Kitasatospora purpeofusca]